MKLKVTQFTLECHLIGKKIQRVPFCLLELRLL